jgi:hypothetical protein
MPDDVAALQSALAGLGLYRGTIDGIDGPLTRGAVRAAQGRFGMPPTGRADDQLLQRLGLAPSERANPLTDWILGRVIDAALSQAKGLPMINLLSGYKTYIVAAIMLLAGIAGAIGVDIPSLSGQSAGDLILQALAFIFLRQGLKTGITKS